METEEILAAIQQAADTIATPNWADKLSVVISFLAVVVAGFVAWRQIEISKKQAEISDKQNKIALFEKRYAAYCEIAKIIELGESLDVQESMDANNTNILLHMVEALFEIPHIHKQDMETRIVTVTQKILETEWIVKQSIFLFPHINEKDIDDLFEIILDIMASIVMGQPRIDCESTYIKKLIATSKTFKAKYFDKILAELNLTGEV